MQGRLILVHLMCRNMAPFQTEIVDEDKATGILHFLMLVNSMLAQINWEKKGVTI